MKKRLVIIFLALIVVGIVFGFIYYNAQNSIKSLKIRFSPISELFLEDSYVEFEVKGKDLKKISKYVSKVRSTECDCAYLIGAQLIVNDDYIIELGDTDIGWKKPFDGSTNGGQIKIPDGLYDAVKKVIEEYQKSDVDKYVMFSLESKALKCLSPVLYVYNNNTYEIYKATRDENGSLVLMKKGKFNYDIDLILKGDMDKHEVYSNTTYILKDSNGKEHWLKDYEPIDAFLKSIDVNINICG